jgi:hypothetical protein
MTYAEGEAYLATLSDDERARRTDLWQGTNSF